MHRYYLLTKFGCAHVTHMAALENGVVFKILLLFLVTCMYKHSAAICPATPVLLSIGVLRYCIMLRKTLTVYPNQTLSY